MASTFGAMLDLYWIYYAFNCLKANKQYSHPSPLSKNFKKLQQNRLFPHIYTFKTMINQNYKATDFDIESQIILKKPLSNKVKNSKIYSFSKAIICTLAIIGTLFIAFNQTNKFMFNAIKSRQLNAVDYLFDEELYSANGSTKGAPADEQKNAIATSLTIPQQAFDDYFTVTNKQSIPEIEKKFDKVIKLQLHTSISNLSELKLSNLDKTTWVTITQPLKFQKTTKSGKTKPINHPIVIKQTGFNTADTRITYIENQEEYGQSITIVKLMEYFTEIKKFEIHSDDTNTSHRQIILRDHLY